ncbi:hypothetical protein A5662_21205 [Mycobacteriaceae bacterium 1482268.1]|nr:hypothetical protein A5662_21205 [Mycobacteriaceae bacterium 1482268.1]
MNTSKLAMTLGSACVVTAAALTAAAPATAAPKPSGATLFLCPDFGKPGYHRVTVRGVFPMAQADAVGYVVHLDDNPAKPGGMVYYLQADDGHGHEGDESLVYLDVPHAVTDGAGYLRAGPGGLEYQREFLVSTYALNEDNSQFGWMPEEHDEIYAAAKFVDADGGSRTQISQQITREFSTDRICDGCCS